MYRIAAVLKVLTQLNKSSINNFIRHECQNGILGGCFFILFDGYDNSVMESFFSNMKREELYRTKYRSEKELRAAVDAYIKFYNGERPHSKNQYKTPDRKEAEYYSK